MVTPRVRGDGEDEVAEMIAAGGYGVIDVNRPTTAVQRKVAVRTAGLKVIPDLTVVERGGVENLMHCAEHHVLRLRHRRPTPNLDGDHAEKRRAEPSGAGAVGLAAG